VEDDWYADYQDWFVFHQLSPGTTAGGSWGQFSAPMRFSCCADGAALNTAIAELILSPVALVAPDPIKFSTVGLSPATASNPVGTSHTVTALASAANDAPIAGVTIDFKVLTGPNAGKTGSGVTGADGKTTFTYQDTGGAGTDTIQAFIGATLSSNQVTKTWVSDQCIRCVPNRTPICPAPYNMTIPGPPDANQFVTITPANVVDPEGQPLTYTAVSIFQDEPRTGAFDATKSPITVRNTRAANGNGRVYTITFRATDPEGAFCTSQIRACVPNGNSCVNGGAYVNSAP
jgi:hypothetical protein